MTEPWEVVVSLEKHITIVGLGPGGTDSLTVGALEVLKKASALFIRTSRHPVVGELSGQGIKFKTFDYLYEKSCDFEKLYAGIAEVIINAAREQPVVYAVPGHPLVGEESVLKIIRLAREANLGYEILPAMSFLDPVITALRLNLSEGIKLIDGLGLMDEKHARGCRPDPLIPNLVMQVYNSMVASEVKLSLMDFYPDEHRIKVITAAGIPGQERIEDIPLFELDRLDWIDHLTCVYIPPYPEAKAMVSRFPLDRIVNIMEQLRGENGCPWDREQTHASLKRYLIEETYEVLEAIDEGNMYKVCEELGDLLLQIAFHAQIARESGFFDLNDVVEGISEKLVRRHPHVFGSATVNSSREVSVNWEKIKKGELEEKGETRQSLLDGIPQNMPALMKAEKIQRKAAKVGFDWPEYTGALDKVMEEIDEIKEAVSKADQIRIRDEIGDLLFAVVNLARLLEVNSEEALTAAIRKFKERFKTMETLAAQARRELGSMDLAELDSLWEEAKTRQREKKT